VAHPRPGHSHEIHFRLEIGLSICIQGKGSPVGRRSSSLLLFVGGYLAMALLAPSVALVPALLSFFAGVLVLIREPATERAG
jgi:hypothetical protein